MKYPFLFLIISVFLSGCTKEYSDYPYCKLELPVQSTVRDVWVFDHDRYIISGGDDDYGFTLHTDDGGTTWNSLLDYFDNPVNCLYFLDEQTGYAADEDILIYKTGNSGTSWGTYYASSWPLTVNRNMRAICFTNDSTGFVCGGKNLGNGVLFRTQDKGEYWAFTEYNHEYRGIAFADELNGIMCGYSSMLITHDGGQTFEINGPDELYYTGALFHAATGSYFVCDFNGSVLQSTDKGLTWQTLRKGSTWNSKGAYLNSIDVSNNGRIVCAGPNGYLTWSDNHGASWNQHTSFNGTDILKVKWIDNMEIIATGKNGGVFRVRL